MHNTLPRGSAHDDCQNHKILYTFIMFKRVALTFLLSVCVALAGMPVQAMPDCPMVDGAMQSETMASQHDCNDCPEMAQSKQQKNQKASCCDDMACGSLCSVTISMNVLPAFSSDIVQIEHDKRVAYAQNALTSHASNPQDRPPRPLV